MQKIFHLTFIFLLIIFSCASAEEKIIPMQKPNNTIPEVKFSDKKNDDGSGKYNLIIMNSQINGLNSNLNKNGNPYIAEDLLITNPYKSYDAKFKYIFDFNIYNKKIQLIPKIRLTQKTEEKINIAALKGKNSLFEKRRGFTEEKLPSSKLTSSQTNSIFIGMDLSYAIDKDIYLDSNLSFYQTALEMTNEDKKEMASQYRFKENAMSLAIGLRKKITDRLSAGLLYSWKKWFNETDSLEVTDNVEEKGSKAKDESSKALNLMLRYDF